MSKISSSKFCSSDVKNATKAVITVSDLHKSIIMIDELYMESTDTLIDQDKTYLRAIEACYHAKQCWLTNLIAGQQAQRKNLNQKAMLPNFKIKTLNVSFRSAHHISTFSTNFVHRFKGVSRTSVRVPGCLTSSQSKIALQEVSSADDLVLNDNRNTSQRFASDRRALVFSDTPERWQRRLAKESLVKITVVSPQTNFKTAPYTGCEAWSVIIVIDDLPDKACDKTTFGVLNLAITRAQYEVCIFATKAVYKRIQNFLEENEVYMGNLLLDAANHITIDLSFLKNKKWDEKTKNFVGKMFQISMANCNKELFKTLLDLFPGEDGNKDLPIRVMLFAFDSERTPAFDKLLSERVGEAFARSIKLCIINDMTFKLSSIPNASS